MPIDSSKSEAIVIVGAGFAGLIAAMTLSRVSQTPPIILIKPRLRFIFQPLLYEFLSNEISLFELATTYKSLLLNTGIVFINDSAITIDTDKERVITHTGKVINYSQLILSTGSSLSDHSIPGVKKYASTFKDLKDIYALQKKIKEFNTTLIRASRNSGR